VRPFHGRPSLVYARIVAIAVKRTLKVETRRSEIPANLKIAANSAIREKAHGESSVADIEPKRHSLPHF
jgi:hypothetical protein